MCVKIIAQIVGVCAVTMDNVEKDLTRGNLLEDWL